MLFQKRTRRGAPRQAGNINPLQRRQLLSRVEKESLQSCLQGLPGSRFQWPGSAKVGRKSYHPMTGSTGRIYRAMRSLWRWQSKLQRTCQPGNTLHHPAEHTHKQEGCHAKVKRLRSEEKPERFGREDTKATNTLGDRIAHLCEKQRQEHKYFSVENP